MSKILKMLEKSWTPDVIEGTVAVVGEALGLQWGALAGTLLAGEIPEASEQDISYLEQLLQSMLIRGKFLFKQAVELGASELGKKIASLEAKDYLFARKMSDLRRTIARNLVQGGYRFGKQGEFEWQLDNFWQMLVKRESSPERPLREETLGASLSKDEQKCAEHVRNYLGQENRMPPGEREEAVLCLCRHFFSLGEFDRASEPIVDNMEQGLNDPIIYYDYFVLAAMAGEREAAMEGYNAACQARPDLSLFPADRFQVERLSGKDKWSTSFQATDLSRRKQVVVKVLNAPPVEVIEGMRNSRKLNHQNIAKIYEVETERPDRPYVVAESLPGCNFREFVEKQGPLPFDFWKSIASQVIDTLAYAHGQNVLHGNLTPEKLIKVGPEVKLIDFELLRLAPWPFPIKREELYDNAFIAPEAFTKVMRPTMNSDVYSLGKTLYFLLTAKLPMPMNEQDVPELFREILLKATETEPSRRYPNAKNFLTDFVQAMEGQKVVISANTGKMTKGVFGTGTRKMKAGTDTGRMKAGTGTRKMKAGTDTRKMKAGTGTRKMKVEITPKMAPGKETRRGTPKPIKTRKIIEKNEEAKAGNNLGATVLKILIFLAIAIYIPYSVGEKIQEKNRKIVMNVKGVSDYKKSLSMYSQEVIQPLMEACEREKEKAKKKWKSLLFSNLNDSDLQTLLDEKADHSGIKTKLSEVGILLLVLLGATIFAAEWLLSVLWMKKWKKQAKELQ